jgi:hypothetical protein
MLLGRSGRDAAAAGTHNPDRDPYRFLGPPSIEAAPEEIGRASTIGVRPISAPCDLAFEFPGPGRTAFLLEEKKR